LLTVIFLDYLHFIWQNKQRTDELKGAAGAVNDIHTGFKRTVLPIVNLTLNHEQGDKHKQQHNGNDDCFHCGPKSGTGRNL